MKHARRGDYENRSYRIVPGLVCNCSGNRNITSALSERRAALEDETMKLAIALATLAGLALAIPTANAEERIGVGVGPVGALCGLMS